MSSPGVETAIPESEGPKTLAYDRFFFCSLHFICTSLPPAWFEHAIPTSDQPQTLVYDRSATGIGPDKWVIKTKGDGMAGERDTFEKVRDAHRI